VGPGPRVLLIDNYDSFTFNIAQALGALGARCETRMHDEVTPDEIGELAPDGLLLGPGPCTPDDAGVTLEAIRRLSDRLPTLGVCLGHQAIGQAFGGRVVRAARPMHGKVSAIHHDASGPFSRLPSPFDATRYNSLLVEASSLPACLRVAAWTDAGEIMAIAHRERPVWGVQFHPESVLTGRGPALIAGWLAMLPSGNDSSCHRGRECQT
jgi:anthranilate synthase/aminodeoxychorismate synthase-like glutamine amidotransferase